MARLLLLCCVMLLAGAGGAVAQSANGFKDCADCPVMIPIAPGSFLMGVPPGEEERENVAAHIRGRTLPQHRVTIGHPFALAKDQVTRADFAAFVAATGARTGNPKGDECLVFGPAGKGKPWDWLMRPGLTWKDPGFPQTERDPVVCVSWDEAKAYAAWLSAKSGKSYRLATEAEWEYAARAGTTTVRFWGDEREPACRYANVSDQTFIGAVHLQSDLGRNFACTDGFAYTAPVGSFAPNPWGLDDMLGNIWEWTEDCWNANYQGAPTDGSAWLTGGCERRVARGSSWDNSPWDVRVAARHSFLTDFHSGDMGFRVARDM